MILQQEEKNMERTRNWYNFETGILRIGEKLREKLLDNNIKFEISGNFDKMHFEILMNPTEYEIINNIIMTMTV